MSGTCKLPSILSATELGAGDGGSDGDVEALGRLAGWVVVGNEQLVGDKLANGWGDAIALVAHNDDSFARELLLVDVLTVEQGAVDGAVGGLEQRFKVDIYNMYMRKGTHRGLHHLGVVAVSRVLRTVDGLDVKPVSNADDGA